MASLSESNGKKWINAAVAIGAILLAYVSHSFILQLGEWFDLEAKITNFRGVSQFVALGIGLIAFLSATKNVKSKTLLEEVYGELSKATWPNKDSVIRLTIGIVIGVTIASLMLVTVDYLIQKLLGLLY